MIQQNFEFVHQPYIFFVHMLSSWVQNFNSSFWKLSFRQSIDKINVETAACANTIISGGNSKIASLFNKIEVERKSKLINVSGAPWTKIILTLYAASHENMRVCATNIKTPISTKTIERRKKNQLGWHPAFHPSVLLIILKATRVCMGHRPCQNRLYIVYKVYGGCELCEGKIKEEDLLIINFTEFMAFRENDFVRHS